MGSAALERQVSEKIDKLRAVCVVVGKFNEVMENWARNDVC